LSPLDHEAIGWEAQLRSGAADAGELRAFDAWLASSPAHRAAWDALQRRLTRWSGAGPAAAAALRTEAPDRRQLLRTGFHLAVLDMAGAGALQTWHHAGGGADLASAVGQRRAVTLADGSNVALDADSRVYRSGEPGAPLLKLARGQLLLRVGPQRTTSVGVAFGAARLSTSGGVLNVGRFDQRSVIALGSGAATLHRPGQSPLALAGGDTFYLDGHRLTRSGQSFAAVTAWQRGLFVADRLPLAQLASVFNRYHRGVIRIIGPAGALQISGVFKLDDVDQALAQVADTLPVEVRRYGAWLTVLS
jgi:transmembrane sensor